MKILPLLIGCLSLTTACEDPSHLNASESPDSQIEITGYLDGSRVHTTVSSPLNSTTPVTLTILGESRAAPPLLTVVATNLRSSVTAETTSGLDGSFVLHLSVLLGDGVNLSLEDVHLPTTVNIDAGEPDEFPALAHHEALYVNRAGFHSNYVFIGVELADPLTEGHLEVRNLSTGYRAVLVGEEDRDNDWLNWLQPDHDSESSHDDFFDLEVGVYFGATLWATPGEELLVYHNLHGVYSQSISIIAP